MRTSQLAARKARLLLLRSAAPTPPPPAPPAEETDPRPEMVCFRSQTLAMVRHYFELSSQFGRLPSLMGREFFRARSRIMPFPASRNRPCSCAISSCRIGRLSAEHQEIVTIAGIYHFTHEEIAQMLHMSRSSVRMWFAEALDALSEIFLEAGVLREARPDRRQRQVMRGVPHSRPTTQKAEARRLLRRRRDRIGCGMLKRRTAKPCRLCAYVMPGGKFCGSPALRRRSYCHFHNEKVRRERRIADYRLLAQLDEKERQEGHSDHSMGG